MTKKQKKQLAKRMAELELVIQKNGDPYKVNKAKDEMMQLTESSDLELSDILEIDLMVSEILSEKI